MRGNGLGARRQRRFRRSSDSHPAWPIAPNLLGQDAPAEGRRGAATSPPSGPAKISGIRPLRSTCSRAASSARPWRIGCSPSENYRYCGPRLALLMKGGLLTACRQHRSGSPLSLARSSDMSSATGRPRRLLWVINHRTLLPTTLPYLIDKGHSICMRRHRCSCIPLLKSATFITPRSGHGGGYSSAVPPKLPSRGAGQAGRPRGGAAPFSRGSRAQRRSGRTEAGLCRPSLQTYRGRSGLTY
jgi:hypothetical protein